MGFIADYHAIGLLAFLVATAVASFNLTRNNVSFPGALAACTIGFYFSALGTRLLYVAVHAPSILHERPSLAFAFWQRGLSWFGAPFGAFLGLTLVFLVLRKPVLENIAACTPGFVMFHVVARFGCLAEGCCYGRPTDLPWAIYSEQLDAMVHPTQVYSMVAELAVAILLQLMWRHQEQRRYIPPLYLVLLGAHRFVTEGFRGSPPGPEWVEGLRFYQVLSLAVLVMGLAILLLMQKKRWTIVSALLLVLLAGVGLVLLGKEKSSDGQMPLEMGDKTLLVVTRPLFEPYLAEWKAFRQDQGYLIHVKAWVEAPSTEEVQSFLQTRLAAGAAPVLIIGDCAAPSETPGEWHIPTVRRRANIDLLGEDYLSDSLLVDVDNDLTPDVPVGRIPARTGADAASILKDIVRYETMAIEAVVPEINVWVGLEEHAIAIPQLAELVLEALPDYVEAKLFGTSLSHTRDIDEPFGSRFVAATGQPALLSAIVAHGTPQRVATGHFEQDEMGLSVDDLDHVINSTVSGPLWVIACDTGRFDRPYDQGRSFCEKYLDLPGGPVAVVGGTITMTPMTNSFLIDELIRQLHEKPRTAGELFFRVQRNLAEAGRRTFAEVAVERPLAQALSRVVRDQSRWVQPGLLREEVLGYVFLGDPTTRLAY